MDRITAENFINFDDDKVKLQRIYPKAYLLDLLQSKSNMLPRISSWEDPYENFFLKSAVKISSGESADLTSIANCWYGQCWSANEESDAMWRIYSDIGSPEKIGIKVVTTAEKLYRYHVKKHEFSSLQTFIGKVKYITDSELNEIMSNLSFTEVALGGRNNKFAKLNCYKRMPFEHEREYRVLFFETHPNMSIEPKIGFKMMKFEIEPTDFIEEIILDPRMSDFEAERLKGEIEQIGYGGKIGKSELYRMPEFFINL
jgi:hypothetical protein